MLYLIGLGVFDEKDLSIRGLEALKSCSGIYAEFYTNHFSGSLTNLEDMTGKKVTILKRGDLEERPEQNVFKHSKNRDIAILISGDPMVATTHIDLILRAKKLGIPYKIIHSSSVYSAIGEAGLQIYKYGKTASLVYPEKNYFPTSPYDILGENQKTGLHTLFLLDIKAEEKRFMTVNEAISLLLEIENQKKQGLFSPDTLCIGIARLGGDTTIKAGKASELEKEAFGKPPHCLIVPGKLHFMEKDALELFK
ncbi:MAG: diphthine synthase [Candidatus Altiarchaeia archaeon]